MKSLAKTLLLALLISCILASPTRATPQNEQHIILSELKGSTQNLDAIYELTLRQALEHPCILKRKPILVQRAIPVVLTVLEDGKDITIILTTDRKNCDGYI